MSKLTFGKYEDESFRVAKRVDKMDSFFIGVESRETVASISITREELQEIASLINEELK